MSSRPKLTYRVAVALEMVGEYFQGYIPLRQTGEDNWVIPASRGSAP